MTLLRKFKFLFFYKYKFIHAINFTRNKKFKPDCSAICGKLPANVERIPEEIASMIPEILQTYANLGYTPLISFGGDCGNVHVSILKYIQKNYPNIPANLTIGEVNIGRAAYFKFTESKFIHWLKEKPEILDCHTWITIGRDTILDATLPTYINTRLDNTQKIGGVLFGLHGKFEIANVPHMVNLSPCIRGGGIRYEPTAVGYAAFQAIAPPHA